MHPHENPVYKKKLCSFFMSAYLRNQLHLDNAVLDQQYAKHEKSSRNKLFRYYGIGALCTLIVDRKYLIKLQGDTAPIRRLIGIFCGLTLSTWVASSSALTIQGKQLQDQMVYHYESQLIVLYPELGLYYQQPPRNSSVFSPQTSSPEDMHSYPVTTQFEGGNEFYEAPKGAEDPGYSAYLRPDQPK